LLWIRNYFFSYPDPGPIFRRVLEPDPDPA
jgi:hypothetical protein